MINYLFQQIGGQIWFGNYKLRDEVDYSLNNFTLIIGYSYYIFKINKS